MTQIIGVNGFKQSGKGTVSDFIFDHYPSDGPVYTLGFADKLKIMAAQAIGFDRPPRDLIDLMDEAKLGWEFEVRTKDQGQPNWPWHEFTGREYLQQFGTRARENFGADFWVDQVLPNPQQYHDEDKSDRLYELVMAAYPGIDCVVFTDLRFENEAERVRGLGGVVWEVTRPGVTSDGHASEQPLPRELVDLTIDNAGSFSELEAKVVAALGSL